ncbi:MAG TPA: alpha/beta fold hydrolase [Candidatus Saccharimonadales bacterium]|nr:alpha/beta fold hydrolase [Candidatus Saccharimonadales bacterium]
MSLAPLATICGTGVIKGWVANTAYLVHRLEGDARPFAIPEFGMGSMPLTNQTLSDDLANWIEPLGPVVKMGHSQGAIHAFMYALDHPSDVCGVVSLCGPLGGTKWVRFIPAPLAWVFDRTLPAINQMHPESEVIQNLRQRIATEWDPEIPVRLIAGASDGLVWPHSSALDLEFPEGTDVRRYYFGRHLPSDLPTGLDVQLVRSLPLASGHLALMFDPRVIAIIHNLRYRQQRPVALVSVAAS